MDSTGTMNKGPVAISRRRSNWALRGRTPLLIILGLGVFQVGFVGYFVAQLGLAERAAAVASGLGFFYCAATGANLALVPALLILGVILFSNLRKRRAALPAA